MFHNGDENGIVSAPETTSSHQLLFFLLLVKTDIQVSSSNDARKRLSSVRCYS